MWIYTILDIETNGLAATCDILEVGYIQITNDAKIIRSGVFHFWKEGWDVGRTDIHGLTPEYLKQMCPDEATFNGNLIRLYTLVQGSVLIGKNSNNFDIPVIRRFLHRNINMLQDIALMGTLDLQEYYTDKFRKWYSDTYGVSAGRKKGTLEELIKMVGETENSITEGYNKQISSERARAHSALYDAYMTYLLVIRGIERYNLKI